MNRNWTWGNTATMTIFWEVMAALKRAFGVVVVVAVVAAVVKRWKEWFTSFRSSWGGGQLGCWEGHHLERWWLQKEACSTPRHCGWRVADVLGWFWSSCCHERHCQPTQGSQQWGTQGRQPSRQEHQPPLFQHSFLCEGICGLCPQGTEARHGWIGSLPFPLPYRLCHVQTWFLFKSSETGVREFESCFRDFIFEEIFLLYQLTGSKVAKIFAHLEWRPLIGCSPPIRGLYSNCAKFLATVDPILSYKRKKSVWARKFSKIHSKLNHASQSFIQRCEEGR